MNENESPVISFAKYLDHEQLTQTIDTLADRYSALGVGYIGATILDRAIPILTLGNPKASKSVMYIGGVSGGDGVTASVLLRFVNDYLSFLAGGRRMFNVNLPYLAANRRIVVIPMLNCDGCGIRMSGAGDHLLRDRLISMNGGEDFGDWCANARGVDLRHNFAPGFEAYKETAMKNDTDYGGKEGYCGTSPESEPETASLCNVIRMGSTPALFLRLHMDDNTLTAPDHSSTEGQVPRARTVGRLLSRMTGLPVTRKEGADGSLIDWCTEGLRRPAFDLGCRYPDTDGSPEDGMKIYAFLREVLFTAPLLI